LGKFQGLLDYHDALVRRRRRDGVAIDPLGFFGEPLDVTCPVGYLAARLQQRLALLGGQYLGQVFLRLHHELEPSTQQRGPLLRRTRPPARQRRIGGFDRAARLRRSALRDLGNRLARRRIAYSQRVTTVRVGPFTVDVCLGSEESLV
jgi:hypothetical protein